MNWFFRCCDKSLAVLFKKWINKKKWKKRNKKQKATSQFDSIPFAIWLSPSMFLQTGNRYAEFSILCVRLLHVQAIDLSSFRFFFWFFSLFVYFVCALTCALALLLSDDQQWFVFNRTSHKSVAQTLDQNTSIGQVASDAARNFVQN